MNFRQLNESFDKMNKELLSEESYTPKVRRIQSVDGSGRIINQYYEEPDFENRAKGDRNVKEITNKQYNDFLMNGKLSEEVTPDNAFNELEGMIERYGADDVLHELARAIGNHELSRSLEYIKRMYGEYDDVDESLKESIDPLVIYRALGTYKVTPKSNYDSHISNARLVNDLRDFTSADEIMDYYIKYGFAQSKDDFIVLDETLKESEIGAIAYASYNGPDVYSDGYAVYGYYDEDCRALESSDWCDDWECVKNKVHEYISRGDVVKIKNNETGYSMTITPDEYFNDFEGDFPIEELSESRGNYGHEGPFWYYTKHGIGPGTLPKDVQVVDIYEDDDFGTYVALDSVLTADELQEYELKEQTPPER